MKRTRSSSLTTTSNFPTMNTFNVISRRSFLGRTAGATAALAALTDIPFVMQQALADGLIGRVGPNGKVKKLLFIFLRGANDGLNNVLPYGDTAYNKTNRPSLYLTPDAGQDWSTSGPAYYPQSGPNGSVFGPTAFNAATQEYYGGLALGNGFAGLHPSLKFLAPVYNAGDLAILHRVGYPRQSRSHFESQNYWETGVPRTSLTKDGVFYRAMFESGLTSSNALTGVSFQSSLPLSLRGSAAAMTNITDTGRYNLLGIPNDAAGNAKADQFLQAGSHARFADKRNRDLLTLQYQNLTSTLQLFADLQPQFTENYVDAAVTDGDQPYTLFPLSNATNGSYGKNASPNKYVVPGGDYGFFAQLKNAAIILNKTDAIIAGTQLDGFDTHSNQGASTGQQPGLLRRVGWAMYALRRYFLQHADKCAWDDVCVVTMSEFGRTTIENQDHGTDHAEASVMYVAGGSVKGYQAAGAGQSGRTGVFGADPKDPAGLTWQTGQTGSMFGVESRYLKRSIDYRSVLGKLIRSHLGASDDQMGRIIPRYNEPTEMLKTGGIQAQDKTTVLGEPDIV